MKFKSRIALGLAVLVLVSLAVTGVAYWSAQEALGPQIEPGLQVNGEVVKDPGVMMTVDGVEIGFDEYRYYYLSNMYYMEMSYGEGIFEQDYDGSLALELRTATETTILQTQAYLRLAEEHGIALTDEEKQEIVAEMDEQKASLGEDAYLRSLQDMFYVDEEMYIELTEEQRLIQKTQETLMEEYTAEIEADLDSYFITAKHILVSPDAISEEPTPEENLLDEIGSELTSADSSLATSVAPADSSLATSVAPQQEVTSSVTSEVTTTELTAEEQAAQAELLAEDLLAQLRVAEASGIDTTEMFDQFVVDYGTDPGMEQSPEGYTFAEGVMVDEFYNAALALQPGEISEVVESDFGYHIIRREALNMEAFEEGGSAEFEVDNLVSTKISEELTALMEAMEVSYGENYELVSPQTIQ